MRLKNADVLSASSKRDGEASVRNFDEFIAVVNGSPVAAKVGKLELAVSICCLLS